MPNRKKEQEAPFHGSRTRATPFGHAKRRSSASGWLCSAIAVILTCLMLSSSCREQSDGTTVPDIADRICFDKSASGSTFRLEPLEEYQEKSKWRPRRPVVSGGGGIPESEGYGMFLICVQRSDPSQENGQIRIILEDKEKKIRVKWDLKKEGLSVLLESPDGERHLFQASGKGQTVFRYREPSKQVGDTNSN
jgi:hypothetical protein